MSQPLPTFGRYRATAVLGQGGMGAVYLCLHPELGFEVAVKVLLAGRNTSSAARKRFAREIRALGKLQHPGIVDIIEAGEDQGVPWFAMRRVVGGSLEDRLRTQGPLSSPETIQLGLQLCEALSFAHATGILHRDLKPGNILCGPRANYVLTDFGLTKELQDASVRLSQTGVLQGTPGYWAPEQAAGQGTRATPATDVYGLGAVLYAALTGRAPISAEGLIGLVIATCEQAPIPPSHEVEVPAELEAIILRCLSKSPGDRYETTEGVQEALRDLGREKTRSGNTAWLSVGVLGVLLAVGATFGVVLGTQAPPVSATPPQASPTGVASTPSTPATPAPDIPTSSSTSDLLQVAEGLEREGRLQEAVPLYVEAAQGGSAPAATRVGLLYLAGEGVEANPIEAKRWFERAAKARDGRGMHMLSALLSGGRGVKKDSAESLRWLKRSALAGELAAMTELAEHYFQLGSVQGLVAAAKWHRKAAEAGQPRSMTLLGLQYERGVGVEKNLPEALRWYRKAEAAGQTQAMNQLGLLHLSGKHQGLPRQDAMIWFRKAADAGDAVGMTNLGVLYCEFALGGEPDFEEGVKWLKKGAEAGDGAGMWHFGRLLEEGVGVAQDFAKAASWHARALKLRETRALASLAGLHRKGLGVPQSSAEAVRLYRLSVEAEDPKGMVGLAELLVKGEGLERNLAAAIQLYQRAASAEDPAGMRCLGALYATGKGFEKDTVKAAFWYEKAAVAGDVLAMTELARAYQRGVGVKQSLKSAFRWYRAASNKGHPVAMSVLSWFYQEGLGVERDLKASGEWNRKAAEAGDPRAMTLLGARYQNGLGLPRDEAKAVHWYLQASAAGQATAMFNLSLLYQSGGPAVRNADEALRWLRKAALAEQPAAMANLAKRYAVGDGVSWDLKVSFGWRLKAAKAGHALSMLKAAEGYAHGRGVASDRELAATWYAKAIEAKVPRATFGLGVLHFDDALGGRGGDLALAARYLDLAKAGYATSLYGYLAKVRLVGRAKAREGLSKSAETTGSTSWGRALMMLVLGRVSAAAMLEKAAAAPDPEVRRTARCEVAFYSGAAEFVEGNKSEAKRLLQICVQAGAQGLEEVTTAQALLKALEAEQD